MGLGYTGQEFGDSKSLWNSFSVEERQAAIKYTGIPFQTFIVDNTPWNIKGWIQLTNDQKRALIRAFNELGMLHYKGKRPRIL